jgi:translation initiation factor 2 alpha subunit (eIF-2alpha)
MSVKKQTKHEKELELARVSAPKYGIYFDGGDISKLVECIESLAPVVLGVVNSESNEATKQLALKLINSAVPSINNCTVSNVSINMESKG